MGLFAQNLGVRGGKPAWLPREATQDRGSHAQQQVMGVQSRPRGGHPVLPTPAALPTTRRARTVPCHLVGCSHSPHPRRTEPAAVRLAQSIIPHSGLPPQPGCLGFHRCPRELLRKQLLRRTFLSLSEGSSSCPAASPGLVPQKLSSAARDPECCSPRTLPPTPSLFSCRARRATASQLGGASLGTGVGRPEEPLSPDSGRTGPA